MALSQRLPVQLVALVATCLSGLTYGGTSLVAAEPRPTGELISYEPSGTLPYVAISVKKPATGETRIARDCAIVVDTSASQTGSHRQQTLQVLDSLLTNLKPEDRVSIHAIDVELVSLSDGFVEPGSPAVAAALAKLRKRVPLGATDLATGLNKLLESFDASRPRAIVYLGDGMSTGQLIGTDKLRALIKLARDTRTAIHSFAVGPKTDLNLVGILAQHTGGVVQVDSITDDKKVPAGIVGGRLANAIGLPIFYPTRVSVNPAIDTLLPTELPPVRSDRDTVLLGRANAVPSEVTVTLHGDWNGALNTFEWTVLAAKPQAGNVFLMSLWADAEKDRGLNLPTAGADLLNLARESYQDRVEHLATIGRRAIEARDTKTALQVVTVLRQVDPWNTAATELQTAVQKLEVRRVALAQAPAGGGGGSLLDRVEEGAGKTGSLLDLEADRSKLEGDRLKREVDKTVDAGNRNIAKEPDAVIAEVKRTLQTVQGATDIDPDLRTKLVARLNRALEGFINQKRTIDDARRLLVVRQNTVESNKRLIDQLTEREDKLDRLIARVSSLLREGYLGNADAFEEAESVARAAWEIDPYSGTTNGAIFNAEAAGQLDKAHRLRTLRADKFLETLHQVELSHVPFPDEPPVLWPPAEVWKALTERRKKWASVDLARYNPAEEKIRSMLSTPTDVQFIDTPLKDCILFLKEQKNINIILEEAALMDEGIATDTPISLQLSGVSLRSILKLMLEPLQLTYVVEDEVMKITTSVKAGEKLTTRVYPVADLVIPIQTPMAGGLGQGAGGVGGLGGAGGQFGGGQFGVGGGGLGGNGFGGGGGLGGGGGFFNVADDAAPPALNNKTIQDRKKKRNLGG